MALMDIKSFIAIAFFIGSVLVAVNCKSFEFQHRIAGGRNASKIVPYMATLFDEDNFVAIPICGGAIISNRHILTAANCVLDFVEKPNRISALIGTKNLDEGIYIEFDEVSVHPFYDEIHSKNDISIMRSSHKFVFVDNVIEPVSLPMRDLTTKGGLKVIASGWGLSENFDGTSTENFKISEQLHVQRTTTIDINECLNQFDRFLETNFDLDDFEIITNSLDEKIVCTSNRMDKGSQVWNNGSPLVSFNLIGIASWTVEGADGYTNIYTSVYHHLDWINEQMKKGTE